MNKLNLSQIVKSTKTAITKHSPEILTGIGIAGMVTTTILAVKATPKALKLMDIAEEEKGEELTKVEVIKAAWKPYIPSAVTGVLSISCLIGASSANLRRNTALATAYSLSETVLKEYKEKVIETIGEKKEQAIKDEIAKDRIEKNPSKNKEVILTGKGDTLCYDVLSGRYFKSDVEKIRKAENALNKKLMNEMYVSLNEFYDLLGLSHTALGEDLGWNIDQALIELDFSTQLSDDETPCLVIDYRVAPKYNYSKLM